MPSDNLGAKSSMIGDITQRESFTNNASGRSRMIPSVNINEEDDDYDVWINKQYNIIVFNQRILEDVIVNNIYNKGFMAFNISTIMLEVEPDRKDDCRDD